MSAVESYVGAHKRVKRLRGSASEYTCLHCQAPARHWAYDHADPGVQLGQIGTGRVAEFSSDPWHYIPLCVRCHFHFHFDGGEEARGWNRSVNGSVGGKKSKRVSPHLGFLRANPDMRATDAAGILKITAEQVRRLRRKIAAEIQEVGP